MENKKIVEDIATNISKLSRQVEELLKGRLKFKTIIVLLSYSTGLPQNTIKSVLEAITTMEKDFLK